eukprot:scaffold10087_cov166-Amphora_coffeaeformis.AAC.4
MKSTSRIVNPYIRRKKEPSINAAKGPASTKALASKGAAVIVPKPISSTKSTQGQPMKHPAPALKQKPSPSLPKVEPNPLITDNQTTAPKANISSKGFSAAVSLTSSRNPKTLKQKLKQDIENLKRAKALQKKKAIEEKRRKEIELLRLKAEEEAQKHKLQQQTATFPTPHTAGSPHASVISASSPMADLQRAAVVSVEKSHPTPTTGPSLVVASVGSMRKVHSPTDPLGAKTNETTTDTVQQGRPEKVGDTTEKSTHNLQFVRKLEREPHELKTSQDTCPISTPKEIRMQTNSRVASDIVESSPQADSNQTIEARSQKQHKGATQTLVVPSPGKVKSPPSQKNEEYLKGSPLTKLKSQETLPRSTAFVTTGPAPLPSYNPNTSMQPLAPYHEHPSPYLTQAFYPGGIHQAVGTNPVAMTLNPMSGSNWYNPWLSYLAMDQNGISPFGGAYGNALYQPTCYMPGPHPPQPTFPPIVSGAYHQRPRPPPPATQVTPKVLAGSVLDYPSPYATTHELVGEPILLLKGTHTSSYGVVVEVRSESALVEPEWLDRQAVSSNLSAEKDKPEIGSPDMNLANSNEIKAPRRRRRRHIFSSMMVLNPEKQNKLEVQRANVLQKGDIILRIGDHSTAGCTFGEACKLFNSATKTNVTENYSCGVYVVVARLRPPQQPKVLLPTIQIPTSMRAVTTMDVHRWAFLKLKGFLKNGRLLGANLTFNDMQQLSASMADTPLEELENAWQRNAQEVKRTMVSKATQHWKMEWSKESPAIKDTVQRTYLSDAQRSRMRAAARPRNGCKCGSKSHMFVNNPACPLYSNLFKFGLEPSSTDGDTPTKSKKIKFQDRKLKTVEAAFTERIAREKLEKEEEEAEATFVDRAEAIQLRELRQAIFAPSLTVMIMSAIAALKPVFDRVKGRKSLVCNSISEQCQNKDPKVGSSKESETGVDTRADDAVDDNDDDDNVPLVNLGKRNLPDTQPSHSKKVKLESINVDLECLAQILLYVSERWGHAYREPSNVDYAWRWELFHGQIGTSNWNTSAQNPRGSLSLENIRFALDKKVISLLQHDDAKTPAQMEAVTLLSVMLDPSVSGIVDEILALRHSSVVRTDSSGIPRLSGSWYKHVDLLVLEEMAACWSFEMDPVGKYGVHDSIRNLATKWIRHEEGWALTSDPEDIIYDSDEFALWREAFETKHEEQVEQLQGVGKYGV